MHSYNWTLMECVLGKNWEGRLANRRSVLAVLQIRCAFRRTPHNLSSLLVRATLFPVIGLVWVDAMNINRLVERSPF